MLGFRDGDLGTHTELLDCDKAEIIHGVLRMHTGRCRVKLRDCEVPAETEKELRRLFTNRLELI